MGTIGRQARWLRGSSRDGSCGSRCPNAQAAAVGNSRKGVAFPRVGKGGARSALSRTPRHAGVSLVAWVLVFVVWLLVVTGLGHTWGLDSRSQIRRA